MNTENYDQVRCRRTWSAIRRAYLQPEMKVMLSVHEGNAVAIELPQRVTLEVVETEPVTKGQTASSSYKPAKLSNGVRTNVPPHHRRRHAHRGDDRGRLLRRAREGLGRSRATRSVSCPRTPASSNTIVSGSTGSPAFAGDGILSVVWNS